MMSYPAMHGSGPAGQPPQMPMVQRDPQKVGGGYQQMQGSQREASQYVGRRSPPGYVDTMSMQMSQMSVSPSSYNENCPEYSGTMV